MAQVKIYTTPICPFCIRAKYYLDRQEIPYQEINVMSDPDKRQEMVERSQGGTTVPQIFIDNQPIGGCDDLYELAANGELNALLHA